MYTPCTRCFCASGKAWNGGDSGIVVKRCVWSVFGCVVVPVPFQPSAFLPTSGGPWSDPGRLAQPYRDLFLDYSKQGSHVQRLQFPGKVGRPPGTVRASLRYHRSARLEVPRVRGFPPQVEVRTCSPVPPSDVFFVQVQFRGLHHFTLRFKPERVGHFFGLAVADIDRELGLGEGLLYLLHIGL